MKKIISVTSFLLSAAALTFAQDKNLSPTVQVTNAYQARFMEAQKPSPIVTIPDSLYSFDLDFDYVGFENPYRGTDDFNPFYTQLEFARKTYSSKRLIFKAGAGYVPAGELDLVWGIKNRGRLKIGAFASHDSYYGKYTDASQSGFDALNKAAVDIRYDFDNLNFIFTAFYNGVLGKSGDAGMLRHYDCAGASLAVNSNLDPSRSPVRYKLTANYSYGRDSYDGNTPVEHVVDVDGFADLVFGKHLIEIDADFDFASSREYSGLAAVVRPRYIFSSGALNLQAGLALSFSKASGKASAGNMLDFFPSVDLNVKIIPLKLEFYANADIESRLFSATEAALQTRFFVSDTAKCIVKKSYASLGFKGRFAEKFHYDLSGGYRHLYNPALYDFSGAATTFSHVASLENYYARLSAGSKLGIFSFGGSVEYRHYFKKEQLSIVPPSFSAEAYVNLRLRNRWNIGVEADYQSYYFSKGVYADDFVNLQAGVRYSFTSRFSVYVKGLNLLGHSLQYVPGHARTGMSILGGIVLTI